MGKEWIGSAITAGASLLGGFFNKNSISSTNKTNLQINRENQKWNEKMMDKQNAWNLAQWNRENDYNSASQQVARLRAAGLNPYLMMQNGSAGSAQSLTSASPGSASMSNTASPVDYSAAAAGVSSAVSQYYNNQLMAANVRKAIADALGQEKQNTWLDARLQAEIENIKQNTRSSAAQAEWTKFQKFQGQTLLSGLLAQQDLQNSSIAESIANQRASTNYISIQAALESANLNWLDAKNTAEVANYAAQTYAAEQSGKLSKAQADLAVQNKLESIARTTGIKLNNKLLNSQIKFLVSKASWEANKAKWDANTAFKHYDYLNMYGTENVPSTYTYDLGGEFGLDSSAGVSIPGVGSVKSGHNVKLRGNVRGTGYKPRKGKRKP